MSSQFDPRKTEEEILKLWQAKNYFAKWKKLQAGRDSFNFIDGPPYTTGAVHLGTAWNKCFKDAVLRYKVMKGFRVNWQPGYDMHGLPIEVKVEKQLGIKHKKEIEELGVAKFIGECRKFAEGNLATMNSQFARLGVWMDWEAPYRTIDNAYIEGVWWAIKQSYRRNLLYKGQKVLTVCPRCETALAKHEQEYKIVSDDSIYVKFPLVGKPNEFILVWTTTPWTLPTNLAVMVHPDFDYARVRSGEETYLLAAELVEPLFKRLGLDYKVVSTIKGKELAGLKYAYPLMDEVPKQRELDSKLNIHTIILSKDYVNLESGTGCVHTAPGTGPEDYEVGKANAIDPFCPLEMSGRFTADGGKYSGMYAKQDADPQIVEDLKSKNLLLASEKLQHEYPTCWRCKSKLIFLTTDQWFLAVSKLKEDMLRANTQVKWNPDWAGSAWFASWLESLQDWCISRQRYWGIPLPIWKCGKCANIEVVGSMAELQKKPKDLHRPYIDEVFLTCQKCGGTMKRVDDVIDVWLDSAAAPWASLGYPANVDVMRDHFPMDFIVEAKDQIRGWFYSLMGLSMAATGKAPYKSVFMHGHIQDESGRKFSKSLGNFVSPDEVIVKSGSEPLRFYLIGGSAAGMDLPYAEKYVKDAYVDLSIFWNTYSFAENYMSLDKFVPRKHPLSSLPLRPEDKWILSRVNTLAKNLTEAMDSYNVQLGPKLLRDFVVDDLSRWYIKLIRERTWVGVEGEDKLAAYGTLYYVLERLLRLSAPFVPLLSEAIYHNMMSKLEAEPAESIHFLKWPQIDSALMDTKLEASFATAKAAVELAQNARDVAKIKLRWPVSELIFVSEDESKRNAISATAEIISLVCNAKSVNATASFSGGSHHVIAEADGLKVYLNKERTPEIVGESLAKEIIRAVQAKRKEAAFAVNEKIDLALEVPKNLETPLEQFKQTILDKTGAVRIAPAAGHEHAGQVLFEGETVKFSFRKR